RRAVVGPGRGRPRWAVLPPRDRPTDRPGDRRGDRPKDRPKDREGTVLLTVDVGTTEIVLGVFDGDQLRHTWRSSTQPERTSDELALLLAGFLEHRDLHLRKDIPGLCVASVVPDVTGQFREMAASYLAHEPVLVGDGIKD